MKMRVVIFALMAISAPNVFAMMHSEDSISSLSETPSQPVSRSNSSTNLIPLAEKKKERCCCAFINSIFESLAHTTTTPFSPPVYSIRVTEEKN